jgi:hypothetical protein
MLFFNFLVTKNLVIKTAWVQRFVPVILATWKAEVTEDCGLRSTQEKG